MTANGQSDGRSFSSRITRTPATTTPMTIWTGATTLLV